MVTLHEKDNHHRMYDRYFQEFTKKVLLAEEEQELIKNYLTVKKIRKRQYLLQEGDVCKCVAFVEIGAMRLYRVNEDGSEHIVAFGLDGSFMTDLYSFLTNEPSTYNIDAIEDSELVLITDQQVMNCEKYPQNTKSSFSRLRLKPTFNWRDEYPLLLALAWKKDIRNLQQLIQTSFNGYHNI